MARVVQRLACNTRSEAGALRGYLRGVCDRSCIRFLLFQEITQLRPSRQPPIRDQRDVARIVYNHTVECHPIKLLYKVIPEESLQLCVYVPHLPQMPLQHDSTRRGSRVLMLGSRSMPAGVRGNPDTKGPRGMNHPLLNNSYHSTVILQSMKNTSTNKVGSNLYIHTRKEKSAPSEMYMMEIDGGVLKCLLE